MEGYVLAAVVLASPLLIHLVAKLLLISIDLVATRVSRASRFLHIRKWALPATLALWSSELLIFGESLDDSLGLDSASVENIAGSLTTLAIGILAYYLIKGLLDFLYQKYSISEKDNLQRRKMVTQLAYIERIVICLLFVIVIGAILLRFESFEKIGGSLLASAGIASVVIGFAAQETVGNILAGFQIAFSQPLRIDDVVVVEGEWGVIEEIRLTYVVVRIWDRRRLVLPIRYFISKPFENWTRTTAQVIGTIFLFLDFKAPVDEVRKKFQELVHKNEKWDGDVCALQVVEVEPKTIKIRGLVSAENSERLFDLRCEVREAMVKFVHEELPESLPLLRTDVGESSQSFHSSSESKKTEFVNS